MPACVFALFIGKFDEIHVKFVRREVVVPMPSRDELGDAHTDPPLDRVILAARKPDPAWTQQVPPGPDGRQRHLSATWDMVSESWGVQGTFRISFPCPIVRNSCKFM